MFCHTLVTPPLFPWKCYVTFERFLLISTVVPNWGPRTSGSRGSTRSQIYITVNGRESTECLVFVIRGPRLKMVGNRFISRVSFVSQFLRFVRIYVEVASVIYT